MIDPARIACYIRWSTDEQGDGTTLAIQRESCEYFLRSQGWKWNESLCFIDEGYSGGTLERPGLSRLRQAVTDGEVSCVVVYKLDRLSRSVLHTVKLVLEEWEGRCHLKSAREPVDTTSAAGKMFFYMLVSYAEWERSLIRERTMAGKRQRAQQGRNPGIRFPYGYSRGERTGDFVTVPGQAEVVRRIFAEYAAGRGLLAIADGLNGEGIPAHHGGRWCASTVRYMLHNEAYRGVLRYGAATPVERALPPVVDDASWQAVQLRLQRAAPHGGRRSAAGNYPLSKLARCTCGVPLVGGQSGGRYRFYGCSARRTQGAAACRARPVRAELLERVVIDAVLVRLTVPSAEEVAEQLALDCRSSVQMRQAAESHHQGQIAAAERSAARLHADYTAGRLDAGLYRERLAELERGNAAAHDRLAQARSRTAEARAEHDAAMRGAGHDGDGVIDLWATLEPGEQRELLRCTVQSVTVWATPVAVSINLVLTTSTSHCDKG